VGLRRPVDQQKREKESRKRKKRKKRKEPTILMGTLLKSQKQTHVPGKTKALNENASRSVKRAPLGAITEKG